MTYHPQTNSSWLRRTGVIVWLLTSVASVWWFFHSGATEQESFVTSVGTTVTQKSAGATPNAPVSESGDIVARPGARSAPLVPVRPAERTDTPAEVAAATERLQQQRVMKTYGGAMYSLQMDTDTFGAVRDLLYEKDRLARTKPTGTTPEAIAADKAALEERKRAVERQLGTALGENGYDQLKLRVEVDAKLGEIRRELAADMADAGTPMNRAQTEELALAYIKARNPQTRQVARDELLRAAESTLSADQIAALERFEKQRDVLNQARRAQTRKSQEPNSP